VRAGIPERVAQLQMTGHKTRSVLERYNIVSGGEHAACQSARQRAVVKFDDAA